MLHTYEACDAVERLSYRIDGIQVSDFVTPSYFTPGEAPGRRNDFLGVAVRSFGVTRNSHISFFNLATGRFDTVIGRDAPPQRNLARRAELHDHPKPARPGDDKLREVLNAYQTGKLAERASGLPQLGGLTRTARYQAFASRLGEKTASASR